MNAVDGEVDNIDCGVGTDTANVDAGDIVANCETVNRVVDNGPGGELLSTFSVLRGQRLNAALARGLRIRAGCRAPCRISGATSSTAACSRDRFPSQRGPSD